MQIGRTLRAAALALAACATSASAWAAQRGDYGQGHILIGQPNPHYLCGWMIAAPQNYFSSRGACMSAYLTD